MLEGDEIIYRTPAEVRDQVGRYVSSTLLSSVWSINHVLLSKYLGVEQDDGTVVYDLDTVAELPPPEFG